MQALVEDNIDKNAQFSILLLPQMTGDSPDRAWDGYLVLVFSDVVLTGYFLSNNRDICAAALALERACLVVDSSRH